MLINRPFARHKISLRNRKIWFFCCLMFAHQCPASLLPLPLPLTPTSVSQSDPEPPSLSIGEPGRQTGWPHLLVRLQDSWGSCWVRAQHSADDVLYLDLESCSDDITSLVLCFFMRELYLTDASLAWWSADWTVGRTREPVCHREVIQDTMSTNANMCCDHMNPERGGGALIFNIGAVWATNLNLTEYAATLSLWYHKVLESLGSICCFLITI